MNVEILNSICINVVNDLKKMEIVSKLSLLSQNIQNMINQPNVPQHQQNVSNLKNEIIDKLRSSKINSFSPFWKENLKKIGFSGLLGDELAENIEEIFNKNQITISVAHAGINDLYQKLNTLNTTITQIVTNFKTLKIKPVNLTKEQSEFAVLIPKIAIKQNIEQFAEEIIEIKKIVDVFNELIISSRPDIKLKTIASSDFSVSLDMLPKVAFGLLTAINSIIVTYASILEIRKHHKELKDQGVPEENLKGIEGYANKKMADSISQGVSELIKKYASNIEAGRKSELSIELNFSLNKLSNRIDNGYNFDVRFSDENIDDEANEQEEKEKRQQIQNMSKNLEFMNLTGEKILCLPEKKEETNKIN